MSFPPIGVPLSTSELAPCTRELVDLDFRNVDVDPDDGTITTPCGHVWTWERGATLSGVEDANGNTYTALDGQMAWEMRDTDGDTIRDAFGLRMDTSDRFAAPSGLRPVAMTIILEFIETGAVTSAGSTLLAHTNDGATGARLWLDTSGTYYRFNYNDGSTTRTATQAVAPSTGDPVLIVVELADDGAVTMYQALNYGVPAVATSAALALPSAWASSSSWRLNARGTGGAANAAEGWYRRLRVMAGAFNLTTLTERR